MTIYTPAFLQNKGYGARTDRQILADLFQAGAMGDSDYKVTTAGTTRAVNVAIGEGYVQGNNTTPQLQGLYRVYSDTTVTLTHDAAVSFPRVDQIVLRVRDSFEAGNSGTDGGSIEIIKGTEASGATLDNRTGAASQGSFPPNVLRLADVLVTVGVGAIPAGNIRDRRTMAKGSMVRAQSLTFVSNGSYQSAPFAALSVPMEISGTWPVRIRGFHSTVNVPNPPSYNVFTRMALDMNNDQPEALQGGSYPSRGQWAFQAQATYVGGWPLEAILTGLVGRRLAQLVISSDNGNAPSSVSGPMYLTAEELVGHTINTY